MTTKLTKEQAATADWMDQPIVRMVRNRHPDCTIAELLCAVSDALNELEYRFPGLTIAQIMAMAPHQPGDPKRSAIATDRIRTILAGAGVSEADIDDIAPADNTPSVNLTVEGLCGVELDMAIAASDLTTEQIRATYGFGRERANRISGMRRPIKSDRRKLAEMVLDQGMSKSEAARASGKNYYTIRWAVAALRFQREQGLVAA